MSYKSKTDLKANERIAELEAALQCAADMLHCVAGDIEDGYSLGDIRGKYVLAVLGARDKARDALGSKA